MFWRRPIEVLVSRKVVAITVAILALTAGVALAASVSGNGTLVGTPGSDTINAGNADDTVWGLGAPAGGSDTINAGNGNDQIDAGGNCPMNDQGQDFPNGLPGTDKCEHGNQQGQNGQSTINVGRGNNTVWGAGGHNTINVGAGTNTIYAGPMGDVINTGSNGNETVWLCGTITALPCLSGSADSTTVNFGTSDAGGIHANNGHKDTINCKQDGSMMVWADKGLDQVNGCSAKNVIWITPPAAATLRNKRARPAAHRAP
jgi:hypothetical protein